MRKIVLFLCFSTLVLSSKAQNMYFLTGSNFSTYDFNQQMTTTLESGTGSFYEIGFSKKLKPRNLVYNIGINLNEYNAFARSTANNYEWNTKYLGIQNALEYRIPLMNYLGLIIQGGINISSIVYGKQSINGTYYNITKQAEFSYINIDPYARLQLAFKLGDIGLMSFGYGICKSFFWMNNTAEKLTITTNQLVFGIHFNIN
jgi:hypothetical protein